MANVDLRLGGCLELMKALPDGSVDAVITDPPYGINIQNHGQVGSNRARIVGDNNMASGYAALEWAASRNLPTIVFASPRRQWDGSWRNLIVWDKGGAVGGGGDLNTCLKLTWELIQVARNGPLLNGRDVSVWRYVVTPGDLPYHTCQKPVALLNRLIETFIPIGATVLDPFMGSGTTGVACVKTGRNFIGMEIDPGYFEIAKKRIAEAQMQPALMDVSPT